MALSKIFDEILIEHYLEEVFDFDNIEPYDVNTLGFGKYSFDISGGVTCSVRVEDVTKDRQFIEFNPARSDIKQVFNASFDINGVDSQYSIETLKVYLRIMLTVKSCISEFIVDNNPECVVIIPFSKQDIPTTDAQKQNIYRHIWRKHPISGYGISSAKIKSFDALCLYRISRSIKKQ